MEKILYFPYISIPNTPWLNRALLYWDEIGSIVPYEYVNNPENLDPYMRQLVEAQLVKQVFPGEYIYQIENFKTTFINLLINNNRLKLCLQNKKVEYVKIHFEKMEGIADDLIKLNLAYEGTYPWYYVEKNTAYFFMTYLAALIGAISNYKPSTDRKFYLQNFGMDSRVSLLQQKKREKLRVRVIDEILPAPTLVDNVNELYNFKLKYSDELVKFRNYIETFLLDLLQVPDNQVDERIRRFKIDSENEINYISEKMVENRWRLDFSSICSIASASISINTGDCAGGSLDLISAVTSILKTNNSEEVNRKPLAYAMYAKRNFSRADKYAACDYR